jgi:hypothetical protein
MNREPARHPGGRTSISMKAGIKNGTRTPDAN